MMPRSSSGSRCSTRSAANVAASFTDGTAKHTVALPVKLAVVEMPNARFWLKIAKPSANCRPAVASGLTDVMPGAVTVLKVTVTVAVGLTDTSAPIGVAPGSGGGGVTTGVTV